MRLTVLTFHPETIEQAEARLRTLFPDAELELDLVYPSIEAEDREIWDDVAPELEERLQRMGRPIRVLHVPPGRFVEALVHQTAPHMVVVAYTHWSERVSLAAQMLAVRNFPTFILGYEP